LGQLLTTQGEAQLASMRKIVEGCMIKKLTRFDKKRFCKNTELLDAINVSASYTRVYLFLCYVDIIPSALPDAKPWKYLGLISSPAKGVHRGCTSQFLLTAYTASTHR
jgi:hypothetical protein